MLIYNFNIFYDFSNIFSLNYVFLHLIQLINNFVLTSCYIKYINLKLFFNLLYCYNTGFHITNLYDTKLLTYYYITLVYNNSFIYSIKFLISILFLIFIRAGIPRYRYDFLTKLGWIKFFLYTFIFFILNYFIFLLI